MSYTIREGNLRLFMGKKILVVDDNPHILEAIELILSSENYDVRTLIKGDDALQTAKRFSPDLIILDLLLSGKNGKEITEELRTAKKTAQIPVIIISAHPTAQKAAEEAGATAFLPKPFDVVTLLDLVSKTLDSVSD